MLKALDIWLPAWLSRHRNHIGPHALGIRHVMLCLCDHFEPFHGVQKAQAMERVAQWNAQFREITQAFSDADGVPPRHTFFYPIEQWDADVVGRIADLCRDVGSEMEIHLHHDRDTAEQLSETLEVAKGRMTDLGMLARDDSGATRFGFIHGNWALDHSHPEGKNCGVPDELRVLRGAGCYADFTLPSAPNRTQTRTINSIYYAREDGRPKSHDRGRRVRADRDQRAPDANELLIVQGPLGLNWRWRKFGVLPRIENSDLTAANPPTLNRFRLWLECRIAVESRPNWLFVKLHTHGAVPANSQMLLGEPMRAFHRSLAELTRKDRTLRIHYVSARELVNIVHAAEAGHSGDPGKFRDFRYKHVSLSPVSA